MIPLERALAGPHAAAVRYRLAQRLAGMSVQCERKLRAGLPPADRSRWMVIQAAILSAQQVVIQMDANHSRTTFP